MLIAIFLMALLALSLAVAAPKIARSIQRDRDLETFHRGMQYRRAIQLYFRKFHAYPPNVDALVNTNNIRFLRKRYTDPITGQDDWKPVMLGQNKTPTAMGFFGQPLAGNASTVAGIGPSGGAGLAGTSTAGASSFGGSSFGSSSFGGSSGVGSIFSSSDSGSSQAPSAGATGSTDNSGGSASTTGTDNSGSGGSSGSGTSTGSSTTSGSSTTGSASGFGGGQTFGGAGIIGFSPGSPKQSILVYKKKNHYNEWEFTYDPLSDMQTMGGGNTGLIGQQPGQLPGNNNPGGLGLGSSLGPSGPGSNNPPFGGSPSPVPAPMPPETQAPQ